MSCLLEQRFPCTSPFTSPSTIYYLICITSICMSILGIRVIIDTNGTLTHVFGPTHGIIIPLLMRRIVFCVERCHRLPHSLGVLTITTYTVTSTYPPQGTIDNMNPGFSFKGGAMKSDHLEVSCVPICVISRRTCSWSHIELYSWQYYCPLGTHGILLATKAIRISYNTFILDVNLILNFNQLLRVFFYHLTFKVVLIFNIVIDWYIGVLTTRIVLIFLCRNLKIKSQSDINKIQICSEEKNTYLYRY